VENRVEKTPTSSVGFSKRFGEKQLKSTECTRLDLPLHQKRALTFFVAAFIFSRVDG
jgi:hypothetical protein